VFSLDAFVAAFLPLFVALNIPGVLPLYIGMTESMEARARRALLLRAMTVAVVLALLMLFAGEVIFQTLGISVHDLRVGGGLILLVLSITDLVFGDMKKRRGGNSTDEDDEDDAGDADELAVVPLGIPLIIGPAAITTILVTQGQFGLVLTLTSILVNMALVYTAFAFGPRLLARFGAGFSKAVAKVASLFLAAIAVAMIRAGIVGMLAQMGV
jgi:multiple antibiotic resistance protein